MLTRATRPRAAGSTLGKTWERSPLPAGFMALSWESPIRFKEVEPTKSPLVLPHKKGLASSANPSCFLGSPGRTRTADQVVNSPIEAPYLYLYQVASFLLFQ